MTQNPSQPHPPPTVAYANPTVTVLRKRSNAWLNWLGLAGWAFVALFVLVALTFITPRYLFGYPFVFQIFLLAAWLKAVEAARHRRALDALGYIDQAVKLNLPLVLWTAEQSERGVIVRRLARLRVLVGAGQPLGHALVQAVPEMSRSMAGQVGAAERLGQLPRILKWLHLDRDRSQSWAPEEAAFNIAYFPGMLLVVAALTEIIAIFVIPKYQTIFHDFKTPLPWTTHIFLQIVNNEWFLWLLAFYVLIWVGQLIAKIFRTGDRFFGHFVDIFRWYTPILNWAARDQGLSGLCQIIAAASIAGWPLPVALREAADLQSNAVLRKRILRWASTLESGQSIPGAARLAKMPRLMVAMLTPANSAEDLAQTMSFLATHYETRSERAQILFQAAYIPIIVALMGLIIGFVALSLFMPIVTLINTIANHYPGSIR